MSHSKFSGSDTKKAASKIIAVAKLSWPASSCYSNHVPYAYRETYGREEWGMGETKTKFFFFLFKFPFFIGCCQEWDLSTQRYGNVVTTLSRLSAFRAVQIDSI